MSTFKIPRICIVNFVSQLNNLKCKQKPVISEYFVCLQFKRIKFQPEVDPLFSVFGFEPVKSFFLFMSQIIRQTFHRKDNKFFLRKFKEILYKNSVLALSHKLQVIMKCYKYLVLSKTFHSPTETLYKTKSFPKYLQNPAN